MASKTCPLCGGRLKNNYCGSCGYNVPESEELSALYNYDPSDYPQAENEPAPVREMYPDRVDVEEIYPNRPEPIKFKVRNDDGKTVNGAYGNPAPKTPYQVNDPPANNAYQNPYANQGAGRNNTPPRPYYTPPNKNNPYANINSPYQNINQNTNNGQITNFGELFKKYWWLMLVCFAAPVAGIIIMSVMKRSLDKKYTWVFVLAIVLGIFLPP